MYWFLTNGKFLRVTEAPALLLTNEETGQVTLVFDNRRKSLQKFTENEYCLSAKISVGQNSSPISFLLNGRVKTKKQVREFLKDINLNVQEPSFIIQQNTVISLPNMNPQQLWDQITAVNGSLDFEQHAVAATKELVAGLLTTKGISNLQENRR